MQRMENQRGFALVEVLVATVVFAIGVLGLASMQYRAVHQNTNSNYRNLANAVALSVLEELKRLPFDDPSLVDTDPEEDLNAGEGFGNDDPDPDAADHRFTAGALPVLGALYDVNVNNNLVDRTGKAFQVFWNVQPTTIMFNDEEVTPFCTIKLYIFWENPRGGRSHLEMTTVKQNNLEI